MLASAPVLAHYDPSLETILQTDASHFGWGFFVSQINAETREHPIAIELGNLPVLKSTIRRAKRSSWL